MATCEILLALHLDPHTPNSEPRLESDWSSSSQMLKYSRQGLGRRRGLGAGPVVPEDKYSGYQACLWPTQHGSSLQTAKEEVSCGIETNKTQISASIRHVLFFPLLALCFCSPVRTARNPARSRLGLRGESEGLCHQSLDCRLWGTE